MTKNEISGKSISLIEASERCRRLCKYVLQIVIFSRSIEIFHFKFAEQNFSVTEFPTNLFENLSQSHRSLLCNYVQQASLTILFVNC